jgi:hypothetical protein
MRKKSEYSIAFNAIYPCFGSKPNTLRAPYLRPFFCLTISPVTSKSISALSFRPALRVEPAGSGQGNNAQGGALSALFEHQQRYTGDV